MAFSFDLIDQPWIPCLVKGEPGARELSLRETLARAPDLVEIADPSPLVTVSLHRLLLAILHRCFGPASASDWIRIWEAGRFDLSVLDDYFARWRHRFDLFDTERPFYQVSNVDLSYAAPISRLHPELASGNNATLFDHSLDRVPRPTPPRVAARLVVATQSFAVGGLVSFERGQEQHRSADAAPLVKGAAVLVRGQSLFETLLLALHRYDPAQGVPFEASASQDLPAWERDDATVPQDREPAGYVDLLTWQSRRIRLEPELADDGSVVVRRVVMMKGFQFPDRFSRYGKETMVAFVKRERAARNEDPWPAVGFSEDRALWRDSLALFQSVHEIRSRPKTIDWLSELTFDCGALQTGAVFPLEAFGLCTDRAKVLLWRHERLALPLAYLRDDDLVGALRAALEYAEATARSLLAASRRLSRLLLAPESDDQLARQPNLDAVRTFQRRLNPDTPYWSVLEVPFRQLLLDLPRDRSEQDGLVSYGATTLPHWREVLRRAALSAFRSATNGLEGSARALRALALAERDLQSRLAEALDETAPETAQGGVR